MKELKTKCTNCKAILYQGKFVIYGSSQRKYCQMLCALLYELDRAKGMKKAYTKAPQLKQYWQEEIDYLNKHIMEYLPF